MKVKKRKTIIIATAVCIVLALAVALPAAAQDAGWFTARIEVDPEATEAPEASQARSNTPQKAVESVAAPIRVRELEIDENQQNDLHILANGGRYEEANALLASLFAGG